MDTRRAAWPALALWIAAWCGAAAAVGCTVAVLLTATDSIAAGALSALHSPPPRHTVDLPMVFLEVDGPPVGVARGIQIGLFALLFGSVPAAVVATSLSVAARVRRRRWTEAWQRVFWLAQLFQISGLGLIALLLTVVVGIARSDPALTGALVLAAPLLAAAACATWGLRCWRQLQLSHGDGPIALGLTLTSIPQAT